jgi:hypothetical protein
MNRLMAKQLNSHFQLMWVGAAESERADVSSQEDCCSRTIASRNTGAEEARCNGSARPDWRGGLRLGGVAIANRLVD